MKSKQILQWNELHNAVKLFIKFSLKQCIRFLVGTFTSSFDQQYYWWWNQCEMGSSKQNLLMFKPYLPVCARDILFFYQFNWSSVDILEEFTNKHSSTLFETKIYLNWVRFQLLQPIKPQIQTHKAYPP